MNIFADYLSVGGFRDLSGVKVDGSNYRQSRKIYRKKQNTQKYFKM